ncbi:Aste57867_18322 [Aphanomyces stellatus]|uniref:Aste57867_18322 protein n=1 Tax=Aphanomyces stellatus TaxID=120398 RepID=A0A485LBE1_9STRA|nr:hypothetical protein As57867_018260 [Aphanomyces stellatus]KAF0711092.1 hypothetical protein As57867_005378 [Aphanomyces stellatus]VFT82449.1 Aste57867_5391 [Aphanomyces stellatus]VFT95058.1 Aste57867_18322 [Aphanomyces stellatus]
MEKNAAPLPLRPASHLIMLEDIAANGVIVDMESHPLYRTLSHIKTKRVKELEFYKRYIYTLQAQVSQNQRRRTSLLPWEEVARALQDDTLDRVRDNRRLQQNIEANRRLCALVKPWIQRLTLEQPRLERPLNAFDACWRQAHLFAGDERTRTTGTEWLIRHMYHNMERALHDVPFPSSTSRDPFIDVRVADVPADYSTSGMELQATQQFVMPFSLEQVADGIWAANRTFAQYYLKKDFERNYHGQLSGAENEMEYAQEEIGTPEQSITMNWIQGRFHEADRTSIVVKTIADDMFPLQENAWSMSLQHWITMTRAGPHATLCRVHYSVQQPITATGFVPIRDVSRQRKVEPGVDDVATYRLLVEREIRSHTAQRQLFPKHLETVLTEMAALKVDEIKPETHVGDDVKSEGTM